jgi:hypothetical protein
MLKMSRTRFIRLINISLAILLLTAGAGQAVAKGSGGGRTFDVAVNPGSCILADNTIDPLASPSMVLRSAQGITYFILQVVGSNSIGTWDITFTTNGVANPPITSFVIPPPGGWAMTGGQVDQGAKSIKVVGVARNTNNRTVCTATVEKVF